jgi:hypothetical protein
VSRNLERTFEHVIWDGNQISTWHGNHGDVVSYHMTGTAGLEWPVGSGKTAVFQSGLWLAAGRINGVTEVRTAACGYSSEYVPGNYGSNQDAPEFHIYSIHSGDDASNPDWQNWPVGQGAPWVDVDGDGVYDPNVDHPDINGDLFHWYVMNDGNSAAHVPLWSTQPLGVEIRVSLFGLGPDSPLKDVLFIKWEIENTGGNQLDSMYISLWSDPDIGSAMDDFVGCDPESNLGYSYNDFNGDVTYGYVPPAVGYVFLQTPIVPSPGDTAWVSGDPILDFANIPMSAFSVFFSGNDLFRDPATAQEAYNYMNGLIGMSGQPYIDPITGQPSTFVFSGDPVTDDGWVDYNYYPSGDRRFLMTAGPISMAPSDIQEIVAAIVIAQGTDNISSVTLLRQLTPWVQLAYDTDFNIIGPPLVFSNHTVPATTEDVFGPYHLEVDIHANTGFVLNTNSAVVYYGVDSIASVVTLGSGGTGNTFSADVSGNGSAGMFKYYFYAEDNGGNGVYYPPGAPTSYFQFEVGPDQVPPVIDELTEIEDTIYPAGSEEVKITATDRFPLEVTLNYQVNSGSVQSQVMNQIPETDRYETTLTWSGLTLGDQIAYWVDAVDGSSASNVAVSDTHVFAIKDSLAVGDWETWQNQSVYRYDLDQNQWLDSAHWYSPRHGRWAAVNLDGYGVDAGWIIIAPVAGVQPDTVISGLAIDVVPFQEASLAFRYACSVNNVTAHVEVAPNYVMGTYYDILDSSILHLLNWTLVDSLVAIGGPGISGDFVEQEVSLSSFDTPLFIRITAQAPSASTPFILDDIYLKVVHSLHIGRDLRMIPGRFALHQNYPNPFNPNTTIRYDLSERTQLQLVIYDLLGREVRTLVSGLQEPGFKAIVWDGKDAHGQAVGAGVYLYRLRTTEFVRTRKLVVLK